MITINKNKIYQTAQKVINIELQAIAALSQQIDDKFIQACELLLNCQGRIILTGMGKSGHIANKIAATFASTGSPAFFLHPAEASHGDLGMMTKEDIVIAISSSGNTNELLAILPLIKHLKIPFICLTGNLKSILAKEASICLNTNVAREACPLNLAPTASTTTALVMGDALAIALLETRGFTENDFAMFHPGGSLGKRLLLRIDDFIYTDNAIPKVKEDTILSNALKEMSTKKLGLTIIIDKDAQPIGIFTDGDLRRTIEKGLNIDAVTIKEVMTKNYRTILPGASVFDAIKTMEQYNITSLIVKDQQECLIGILHIHDILKAGLV